MSKTSSNGTGQLVLRLVLCVLLVFTLLGTAGGALGSYLLSGSGILTSQLEKQAAAQKAHDTLEAKFEAEYNTTAIPAEVYMDVITTEWMAEAMERYATAAQSNLSGAKTAVVIDDFTPLEESITAYFEAFAAENNVEKDEAYTKKLEESIQSAEDAVKSAVDVYHVQTMMDAGIWAKLKQLRMPLWILVAVCGVLSVALAVLLRKRFCYWVGSSLFACGALLTIPTAVVLGTGVISHFTLKEPAVYAVFTGVMTQLMQLVMVMGIVLLAVGTALWLGSVLLGRKKENS